MRKFIAFIGIVALLLGLRLFDNGLLAVNQSGVFTVYGKGGVETVYAENERPLLFRSNEYSRLDVCGDYEIALSGLDDLYAQIVDTENVSGLIIIYAYSPYINRFEVLKGERVNVMVAVGGGKVVYGSPIIKGSY